MPRPALVRVSSVVFVAPMPITRGSHSSTFRLNVSALCGIGGAFRGCLGGVLEVFLGV